MVLLVLALFFIMLLWMGDVGINQSHAVLEARYKAWGQRDAQRGNPFDLADTGQGLVSGSTERPISLSPLVDNLIKPRASHTVYAGTWQHPHVDLNQSPNRDLYRTLIQKVPEQKRGELGDVLGKLDDVVIDALNNLPKEMADEIMAKVTKGFATGKLDGLKGQLLRKHEEAKSGLESMKREERQKTKADVEARRKDVQTKIEKAERDLKNARDELSTKKQNVVERGVELEREKVKQNKDEQKIQNLEMEIKDLDKRIRELEQNEIPRLEKGINSLKQADAELEKSLGEVDDN